MSTKTEIPEWNDQGLIPPTSRQPTDPDRSPYRVSLSDFVMRFATSVERIDLLIGLLEFRQELAALGVVEGFQWINGSFAEHVELRESRAPRDIDVVTFVESADPLIIDALFRSGLVERAKTKARFSIDSYFEDASENQSARGLVAQAAYWYSVWSHRRDGTWKGFVQIDLDPTQDISAAEWLNNQRSSGTL